eukprot:g6903.t1
MSRLKAKALREAYEVRKNAERIPLQRPATTAAASSPHPSLAADPNERWTMLWQEVPCSTFSRSSRFDQRKAHKPSMRAYLQYLKQQHSASSSSSSPPPSNGGVVGGGDGVGSEQPLPTSPIDVRQGTPGPGQYNPRLPLAGRVPDIRFSRVFPRFPDPIPVAKRDCVKLKYPAAQEADSRRWRSGALSKSIEPKTQRTDFTKANPDRVDGLLLLDSGSKVSLSTGCRRSPQKYSTAFRSKHNRSLVDASSDPAMGPGRYTVTNRSTVSTALEFYGVSEPQRPNPSFLSPPRRPLQDGM